MIIAYFLCCQKYFNYHSWITQYPIFHKNFQRIYGRNNSFTGSTKVHEYTADSCTAYGSGHVRGSYQEAFALDMRIPVSQNFTKRLIMAASNMVVPSG